MSKTNELLRDSLSSIKESKKKKILKRLKNLFLKEILEIYLVKKHLV